MEDWKQTVAANLTALRKSHQLTQLQLADKLHYSDKAVSKWERGESLPDLAVMKQLADFYGITIDDFLRTEEERAAMQPVLPAQPAEEDNAPAPHADPVHRTKKHNRLIIAGMVVIFVWLIVSVIFVVLEAVLPELRYLPFLFLYAAPVTAVILLVFNSIWFNPRRNYTIISFLVWSMLTAMFFTFYEHRLWKLFLIGIPAQLIIILWSLLRPVKKRKDSPAQP